MLPRTGAGAKSEAPGPPGGLIESLPESPPKALTLPKMLELSPAFAASAENPPMEPPPKGIELPKGELPALTDPKVPPKTPVDRAAAGGAGLPNVNAGWGKGELAAVEAPNAEAGAPKTEAFAGLPFASEVWPKT